MFCNPLAFRRLAAWALIAIATAAAVCVAAPPADPARLMPDGTLVLLGWPGADSLAEPLSATALGKTLNEPEVKQFFDQAIRDLDQGLRRNAANNPGPMASLTAPLLSTGGVLWQRPCALGLINLDAKATGPDMFEAALVIDLGDKKAAFQATLEQIVSLAKKANAQVSPLGEDELAKWNAISLGPQAPAVAWTFSGDRFAITLGKKTPKAIQASLAGGKTLADSPEFVAVRKGIGAESAPTAAMMFVDVARLRNKVMSVIGRQDMSQGMAMNMAMTVSGLDGLSGLGASLQLADGGLRRATYLHAEGARRAALKALEGKPITDDDLAIVPNDATFAYATNLDLAAVLASMTGGDGKAPAAGDGNTPVDLAFAQMEKSLGVNVRNDIIGSLGDTWVIFDAPSNGGLALTGLTVCIEVANPARIQTALRTLLDHVAGSGSDAAFRRKTVRYGSDEVSYITATREPIPVAPAWAIKDGHLVIGPFPQTVRAALARMGNTDAKASSIIVNHAFAEGRKFMPADANAIGYFDTPRLINALYTFGLPAAQQALAPMRATTQIDISAVPGQASLLKHAFPAVSATRADEHGILMVSRASLPLLPPSVAELMVLSPVAALITGRATTSAKVGANRTASLAQLRTMGMASAQYASDHEDELPPSLESLKSYLDGGDSQPARGAAKYNPADFELVTGFPKLAKIPKTAEMVLIYETPAKYAGEGTCVLYADGHVQWRPVSTFQTELEATREFIRSAGDHK